MGKRKIALFYDEGTESGKQILEFLMPFDKRKSDIVGELILLWIAEHGTNVPVQWHRYHQYTWSHQTFPLPPEMESRAWNRRPKTR